MRIFSFLIADVLAAVVLAGSLSPVKHFRLLEKSQLPQTFLQTLCSDLRADAGKKDCIEDFNKNGAVWAGDVNNDGVDEFIVDDGGMPGTLGPSRHLIQRRGNGWVGLACLGAPEKRSPQANEQHCDSDWNTFHSRFDILPVVRHGHHDLRIEVDHCLKWDGRHYIDYSPSDYSRLHTEWFDSSDSHEAEIFWAIRYHDRKAFKFEPVVLPAQTRLPDSV